MISSPKPNPRSIAVNGVPFAGAGAQGGGSTAGWRIPLLWRVEKKMEEGPDNMQALAQRYFASVGQRISPTIGPTFDQCWPNVNVQVLANQWKYWPNTSCQAITHGKYSPKSSLGIKPRLLAWESSFLPTTLLSPSYWCHAFCSYGHCTAEYNTFVYGLNIEIDPMLGQHTFTNGYIRGLGNPDDMHALEQHW